jgi:hypothetical protein
VRRHWYVCAFAFLALISAKTTSAQGILPPTFGSWSIGDSSSPDATLANVAGADAPILQEYGFQSIEHRNYVQGKDNLSVTLYRMEDPTAAFGAFTFLRPEGMPSAKIAQFSAESPNRALIVDGNFLLDVTGKHVPAFNGDYATLLTSVTPKADTRPYPNLEDHLPTDGAIPGSERYAVGPLAMQKLVSIGEGDWAGFSLGAEAMLAKYRKAGKEASLLVIEYPTQQLAEAQFEKMKPLLDSLSEEKSAPGKPSVTYRRESTLIVLAFDSHPAAYGKTLLSQVAFGHNVVWNEPTFKATQPSMNVYIIGAFTGAGAICLIAIVSGLGFGLLRLVIKFFFPGKVFDRPRARQVIQLNINGRGVDTKDFY